MRFNTFQPFLMVLNQLLVELASSVAPDRLGPTFFNDDERQQWQDYFDQQPLTAEAASDAATLLPVQMPRKCLPRTAAAGSSGADLRIYPPPSPSRGPTPSRASANQNIAGKGSIKKRTCMCV